MSKINFYLKMKYMFCDYGLIQNSKLLLFWFHCSTTLVNAVPKRKQQRDNKGRLLMKDISDIKGDELQS